jgi:pimeloyl-ACP methyl ester carboxylesterase
MARDVEAVIDALGFAQVPVAGWSMGGFIAQELATTTRRVSALVLLATDPGGPHAVRAEPSVWAQLLDNSGTPREQASRLVALLFPPALAPQIDREFGDVIAAARARLDPRILRAQATAMEAWYERDPDRSAVDAPPVLALGGDEDVVIPIANLEQLARRWPGCRHRRLAGCGHAFMAQEADRVASTMVEFLR